MKRGPRSPAAARMGLQRAGDHPAGSPPEGSRHPDIEDLVDFVDGRLARAAEGRIRGHLDACPPCAGVAREFGRLVESLIQEGVNTPPAALSRWARSLPESRPMPRARGVRAAVVERLRGVRAGAMRLVADSWALAATLLQPPGGKSGTAAPAAVRSGTSAGIGGTAMAGRRRLLLAATPFDLDLQVDYRGSADPRHLHGQILPLTGTRREWMGSEVRLVAGRRTLVRTRIDRRGEFVMPKVPPGRYRIEVAAGSSSRAARSTSPPIEV